MIQLTAATLPILASLILAVLAAAWTLLLRRRSAELLPMALFFSSGSAFLLALVVEFTIRADWREYVVVAQYPLVVVAFCALAAAAHAQPDPAAARERRLIRGIAVTSATATIVYAGVLMATRTPFVLRKATELHLQVLMVVVLISFLFALTALLRGAQRHAATLGVRAWQALCSPPAGLARLWRNMALALLIPMLMGIATLLRNLELLSSYGMHLVLGLGAISFVATMTGSLATAWGIAWPAIARRRLLVATAVLALWGCVTTVAGETVERAVIEAGLADGLASRALIDQHGTDNAAILAADLPEDVVYIFRRWPGRALIVSRERDFPLMAMLDDRATLDHILTQRSASSLVRNNPALSRDQALAQSRLINPQSRITHQVNIFLDSAQQRYIVVRFGLDGAIYEVGFSFQAERQEIHAALLPFALGTVAIGLLLGGEALIAAYRGVPRLILPHGR
ncbi:MAG: hypothetical protein HXY37_01365 [Chloroflexi bacterium]|nr:hypothetical protein [Chloroflexota bacterium]